MVKAEASLSCCAALSATAVADAGEDSCDAVEWGVRARVRNAAYVNISLLLPWQCCYCCNRFVLHTLRSPCSAYYLHVFTYIYTTHKHAHTHIRSMRLMKKKAIRVVASQSVGSIYLLLPHLCVCGRVRVCLSVVCVSVV